MLNIYIDDDSVDAKLVRAIRQHGLSILLPREVGMVAADDVEHLEFATAQGRVLLTNNRRDFDRIHREWMASGRQHSGIVLDEKRFSIGERLRRIVNIASIQSQEKMKNNLVYLSNW